MIPLTERWYDPYENENFVYDTLSLSDKPTEDEKRIIEYAKNEEIERKNIFENLYLSSSASVDDKVEDKSMNENSDKNVHENISNLKNILLQDDIERLQTQRAILERYVTIKENHLSKIKDLYIPGK